MSRMESPIGKRILRKEDPRLLRGEGCYVGDLPLNGDLAGTLHVTMVRSQHAHGKILSVDLSKALRMPGVETIISADDLGPVCKQLPQARPHPTLRSCTELPLAQGKVKYVGQAIAAVVAESRYAAEDAAEMVEVEIEPLPAIVDVEQALHPDAVIIHEELSDNIASHITASYGDVDAALAQADHVYRDRFRIHRSAGQAIETRSIVAVYDSSQPLLTVWTAMQQPHFQKGELAAMLDMPAEQIRVIAPDVGGGFGPKGSGYPEEVVLGFLARKLGRPMRWIADRREALMCERHEHEQVHEIEAGFTNDGRLTALRVRVLCDTGAFIPKGLVVPVQSYVAVPGPYQLENYAADMTCAYSNRMPVGPVRGAGRPNPIAVMESVMNHIARETGRDPIEVRKINAIQPDNYPYDTKLQNENSDYMQYDSGNLPGLLDKIDAWIEAGGFREEHARLRQQGVYRGVGISLCVEATGQGPYEGARIQLHEDGTATLCTGATTQGQGSLTTLAQVCAAQLEIDVDDVTILAGDTSLISKGGGAYASRLATVTSEATRLSCDQIKSRLREWAAEQFEARPQDIEFIDGRFQVRGSPSHGATMLELLRTHGAIEETAYYEPQFEAWASGAQAVVVEVDRGTGGVRILQLAAVHDCGVMLNPTIVEGQVQGGIAHGIGETLYERMVYDDQGQYLTASLMDYLMPSASDVPSVTILHQETPSPLTGLGVKGAGEGGTLGTTAAIIGALEDALEPFSVRIRTSPITSEALAASIQQAS